MRPPLHRFWSLGSILSVALFALFAAGCASDETAHRPGGRSGHGLNQPPLAGKETFFNGQILAELTVGLGMGFDRKEGKDSEAANPEHRHHGGGGGFHMGAGGGRGEGGGGRHQGGGDNEGPSDQAERQQVASIRHAANPNPPVMIHLRFTNNGTMPADLIVADFLSPLGNFVIEPEKLSLAPGQMLEVEPMTSRLAGEISGVTITLALRLGDQGEKKNISLTVVPGAASATSTGSPDRAGK